MLASFRSALLMIAALTATVIAPAKAGPSGEPLLPATSATLPKVDVPKLIDLQGTPGLAQPEDVAPAPDTNEAVTPAPSGNLAEMVAQLRGADAGSRELNCLATGVYFEAKSEPLAGQLAVAKVIANRTDSHDRFPGTYCGVLCQRGQFSFVHGSSLSSVPRANKQWQTALAIA